MKNKKEKYFTVSDRAIKFDTPRFLVEFLLNSWILFKEGYEPKAIQAKPELNHCGILYSIRFKKMKKLTK